MAAKSGAAKQQTKGGRPTRLTAAVRDRLVELLEKGVYLAHAAPVVGVDRRTITIWIKRGRDDLARGFGSPHAELAQAVEDARAKGAAFMTEIITSAATRDWKAAAWYLERTQPTLFGPVTIDSPQRSDVGDGDEPDTFEDDLAHLNDGELELLDSLTGKADKVLQLGRARRSGS